jgi:hypothetical protein
MTIGFGAHYFVMHKLNSTANKKPKGLNLSK